jgi:hypothetical protein
MIRKDDNSDMDSEDIVQLSSGGVCSDMRDVAILNYDSVVSCVTQSIVGDGDCDCRQWYASSPRLGDVLLKTDDAEYFYLVYMHGCPDFTSNGIFTGEHARSLFSKSCYCLSDRSFVSAADYTGHNAIAYASKSFEDAVAAGTMLDETMLKKVLPSHMQRPTVIVRARGLLGTAPIDPLLLSWSMVGDGDAARPVAIDLCGAGLCRPTIWPNAADTTIDGEHAPADVAYAFSVRTTASPHVITAPSPEDAAKLCSALSMGDIKDRIVISWRLFSAMPPICCLRIFECALFVCNGPIGSSHEAGSCALPLSSAHWETAAATEPTCVGEGCSDKWFLFPDQPWMPPVPPMPPSASASASRRGSKSAHAPPAVSVLTRRLHNAMFCAWWVRKEGEEPVMISMNTNGADLLRDIMTVGSFPSSVALGNLILITSGHIYGSYKYIEGHQFVMMIPYPSRIAHKLIRGSTGLMAALRYLDPTGSAGMYLGGVPTSAAKCHRISSKLPQTIIYAARREDIGHDERAFIFPPIKPERNANVLLIASTGGPPTESAIPLRDFATSVFGQSDCDGGAAEIPASHMSSSDRFGTGSRAAAASASAAAAAAAAPATTEGCKITNTAWHLGGVGSLGIMPFMLFCNFGSFMLTFDFPTLQAAKYEMGRIDGSISHIDFEGSAPRDAYAATFDSRRGIALRASKPTSDMQIDEEEDDEDEKDDDEEDKDDEEDDEPAEDASVDRSRAIAYTSRKRSARDASLADGDSGFGSFA